MATFFRTRSAKEPVEDLGGQMSFLEHLDELRRRLMWSILFVVVSAMGCWFASGRIYNFLAIPIERALAEAQRSDVPIAGLSGSETILPLNYLHENDVGRYVFAQETTLGTAVIPAGTTVTVRYARDANRQLGLFTEEPLYVGNEIVPKGVRVLIDFNSTKKAGFNDKLIVNTAIEPFSLYVKVSLYAAVCLSVPFLLWQIWAFVAPGLYPHERSYVFPFIGLSSVSFIIGGAFAYKIIFPPAARYLLGLGHEFRLLLKADDYFDFIIIIMLGMGLIFQMPAITYVLARIGLVTAGYMVRIWKTSVIVILIVAAIVSPTNDIPNMMLFAAPMLGLYVISIFVAWIFGKPRTES
ncbi:MAG: Sec-independent protein translocase protein TatC [Acidobacteria bacterium]|nr:Sec-independent protein translocase protein TatC [Acidobacteriota bacterium]